MATLQDVVEEIRKFTNQQKYSSVERSALSALLIQLRQKNRKSQFEILELEANLQGHFAEKESITAANDLLQLEIELIKKETIQLKNRP